MRRYVLSLVGQQRREVRISYRGVRCGVGGRNVDGSVASPAIRVAIIRLGIAPEAVLESEPASVASEHPKQVGSDL